MAINKTEENLRLFGQCGLDKLLSHTRIGLEKETLRVTPEGGIAQTMHPVALGSALTNPYITTDYSEALLEFITPPMEKSRDALNFLRDVQQFVYSRLDNEILWATSMPCVLSGEESIPIARYGTSNAGRMKHVYRVGLGYRYGKMMQVISGVHFNFSLTNKFWQEYRQVLGSQGELQDFKSEQYMHLIRNLLRAGWLIPYLFGASPAICKSFLQGKNTTLSEFDNTTFYEPFATSLRMGDIGYQNNKENEIGVKACYDSLEEYIATLRYAIETPYRGYEEIGVFVDGEYRQLNANILQIENEYYSTVRPKQILKESEKPVSALKNRGIEYIELRSLDVNAFEPLSISQAQLHFLEAFMLYCLLEDSPYINPLERKEIDQNEMLVAHKGRLPDIRLNRNGKEVSLGEWAREIMDLLRPVCELLDRNHATTDYTSALEQMEEYVRNPDATPSARMLEEMRANKEGFHHFAKRKSLEYAGYFRALEQPGEVNAFFQSVVDQSLKRQEQIESADRVEFSRYLENYFRQA